MRPQFSIRHLLVLTLLVAVVCWAWPAIVPNALSIVQDGHFALLAVIVAIVVGLAAILVHGLFSQG